MSSVKPLESVKKSLGNVSEISKKSLTSVAETVSGESGTSFLKIILYIVVGVLLLAFIVFKGTRDEFQVCQLYTQKHLLQCLIS